MNQRHPPTSTSIPSDLAVFRSPAVSDQTITSINFAPGSSYSYEEANEGSASNFPNGDDHVATSKGKRLRFAR
jgi:hypothetical protein